VLRNTGIRLKEAFTDREVLEWQEISEKLRLCWGISRIFYSLILDSGILEGHDGGLCYALDDARRKVGSDYRHVK
jgi:hypothetical protein